MLHRILLALVALSIAPYSPAQVNPAKDEETSTPDLDEQDLREALDFSQKEQRDSFDYGVGLNIGPIQPWTDWGTSFLWKQKYGIASFSVGIGSFDFSDNYRDRNFQVTVDSQSAAYSQRFFPLGFGPIYLEPTAGLTHWKGDIQPQGDDPLLDELTSALSSRYDLHGVSLGVNLGLMWIFSNRIFLDYNLIGINKAFFFKEYYSVNTGEARANIRRQISRPLSFSNAHIRVGWSWNI